MHCCSTHIRLKTYRIKGAPIYTSPSTKNHHCSTTKQSIACSNKVSTRLESIFASHWAFRSLVKHSYIQYETKNKYVFNNNNIYIYTFLVNSLPFLQCQKLIQWIQDIQCLRIHPMDQNTLCTFLVVLSQLQ